MYERNIERVRKNVEDDQDRMYREQVRFFVWCMVGVVFLVGLSVATLIGKGII